MSSAEMAMTISATSFISSSIFTLLSAESRQHAGRMVVVEQLAAEFQIQLAAELVDAVADVLGLHFHVFVVVETHLFIISSPCI